jgi:Tfp pilus assembly protein PilE
LAVTFESKDYISCTYDQLELKLHSLVSKLYSLQYNKAMNHLRCQKGMTLVEIMIALGLAGALGVLIMNNMDMLIKGEKKLDAMANLREMHQMIETNYLYKVETCSKSLTDFFIGSPKSEFLVPNYITADLLKLTNENGVTIYQFTDNPANINSNKFKIIEPKIKFTPNDLSADPVTGDLVLSYKFEYCTFGSLSNCKATNLKISPKKEITQIVNFKFVSDLVSYVTCDGTSPVDESVIKKIACNSLLTGGAQTAAQFDDTTGECKLKTKSIYWDANSKRIVYSPGDPGVLTTVSDTCCAPNTTTGCFDFNFPCPDGFDLYGSYFNRGEDGWCVPLLKRRFKAYNKCQKRLNEKIGEVLDI